MSEKNDIPQYYVGFWAISGERGDRFAFTVDTWRGRSRFFDISGKLVARRIVVYDEKGRELASVRSPDYSAFLAGCMHRRSQALITIGFFFQLAP